MDNNLDNNLDNMDNQSYSELNQTLDEIDFNWIDEFNDYGEFYKEKVSYIKLFFIYVDEFNSITDIVKDTKFINNNTLNKEQLLYIIENNKKHNSYRYKPTVLYKWNFYIDNNDLDKFFNGHDKDDFYNFKNMFFHKYYNIEDIVWEDTIYYFNELNCLFIVFKENMKNSMNHNKTVKKINISKHNNKLNKKKKNNVTIKKY